MFHFFIFRMKVTYNSDIFEKLRPPPMGFQMSEFEFQTSLFCDPRPPYLGKVRNFPFFIMTPPLTLNLSAICQQKEAYSPSEFLWHFYISLIQHFTNVLRSFTFVIVCGFFWLWKNPNPSLINCNVNSNLIVTLFVHCY